MGSSTVRLGDVVNFYSGGTPSKKNPDYWDGDIPWVSAKSMDADGINANVLHISKKGLGSGSKLADPGSILFLTRGSGLFTRIPVIYVNSPVAYNQDIKCLKAKNPRDARYIYHWLVSQRSVFTKILDVTGIGAGKINTDQLKDMEVYWPDETERQRIGQLADPLIEAIHLSQQINDYLEQCLLARYDYLFGTANAYDGTIADIGDVIGGATPSKKKPEYYCADGIGWITPRDLSNTTDKFIAHGADDITQLGYDSCSVRMLPAGTVLFSSRAPIGYIAIATENVTTNQGFKSVVPHEDIGTAFVYCFLKRNKDRIADAGSGTTFPEVSGKTMAGIELSMPDIELCAEFSEWAMPLLDQQRCLEEENRRLGELRDALLPKLMSGEIDVSEVELPTPPNNHLYD